MSRVVITKAPNFGLDKWLDEMAIGRTFPIEVGHQTAKTPTESKLAIPARAIIDGLSDGMPSRNHGLEMRLGSMRHGGPIRVVLINPSCCRVVQ